MGLTMSRRKKRKLTFTRSRPGNSNDGAHVEQKNWAVVRTVVGYHRYDTPGELLLLNTIWKLQSLLTNYFQPQQQKVVLLFPQQRSHHTSLEKIHPHPSYYWLN